MRIQVDFKGVEDLAKELIRKNGLSFEGVANDSLADMFNRAGKSPFTPIDSGELRLSRRVKKANARESFSGEFGYTKDYAPHVEFGHRTRGGGYVSGQHYLKRNLESQRPIYHLQLAKELRK